MYGKPKMLRSYINGNNYLWLLKPNYFNRGRGIQIFQTLEELEKIIVELCEGVEENVFFHLEKEEKENEKNGEKNAERNNEKEKVNEKAANNNDKNKKSTIKLNNFIIPILYDTNSNSEVTKFSYLASDFIVIIM